jgi:acetyl-CoA carboxylase carboxyltransferase component
MTATVPAVGPDRSIGLRSRVGGTIEAAVRQLDGRTVVVARSSAQDHRGALARRDGENLAEAAREAVRLRRPLVLELASSGADVGEGIDSLHGWGNAAAAVAACSGLVPVLAAVNGPVVSGPSFLLGLADLVVMDRGATAFVSGPSMVTAFTGVRTSPEQLGGVDVHAAASGLCALEAEDLEGALGDLLAYLPDHADEEPPVWDDVEPSEGARAGLREVVPSRANASYDMRQVCTGVVDEDSFLELWARWAPQLVTGLARLAGRPVGIVGNQPRALAGTLDITASQKAARFVRFCDGFNLPIVTFEDTPGFLPGKDLEWRGMIRHGAELAFAFAQATVPRLCVIVRKAYGGAYIVMDSKGLGNDLCVAWPGAEIAVMGAQGAVQILERGVSDEERRRLEGTYTERYLTPWDAATRGFVDAVIDPAETRSVLVGALNGLLAKREGLAGRKHDNGPL